MTLHDQLNPQQIKAVTAPDGATLVLAGPGSGKTRVLTHRIAHLIHERGIRPYHIIAVTFTNKAADEMAERVRRLVGQDYVRGLRIGTFHALCARILRIEAASDHLPPYDKNYTIYDTDDQKKVVARAVEDLHINLKRFNLTPYNVLNRISDAKNELILAANYPRSAYEDELIARIYERYQQILQESNAMDFDDLIMQTVLLLRRNADVRAHYQRQFEYVLVDEFQDTNMAQYELVRLWGAPQNNVFVVGDEDQAIYGFRGADYRNVQRFRTDFRNAQTVLLEQNYRSTQMILDAARSVIDRNMDRTPKRLFTDRTENFKLFVHESYDEREEAQFIVKEVERLNIEGRQYSDIAIMYRTNLQSRALEQTFVDHKIPYQLVGGVAFYQRREIKDLLAYLRFIESGNDLVSFERIINTPRRGIGAKTQAQFQSWADSEGISYGDGLRNLANGATVSGLGTSANQNLAGFGRSLIYWRGLADTGEYVQLLEEIVDDVAYLGHLASFCKTDDELYERQQNIEELKGLLATQNFETLAEFLTDTALMTDADRNTKDEDKVTLLTLHASKGLEYDTVFLTGLEDGILPHSRSLDDIDGIEEERRLFYVGMTRAKNRLYLTRAFRRRMGQYADAREPSRFLYDIPPTVFRGQGASALNSGYEDTAYQRSAQWPTRTQSPDPDDKIISFPKKEPQFRSGMRVFHAKFGEGMVIESRLTGDDEEVAVAFEDVGIKRLMASFANLQVLDD